MNPNLKCHFVKRLALYSQRILYGYKCEMEALNADITTSKRFAILEDYIVECGLSGTIINDLNKYRKSLLTTYSNACRGC